MIINQTIKGGFSVVSKTGRYFQLISAGGIVKVRLMLQGSVVFESDMWVGMNLDKPIEFDSVEIKGDDGQIQFWAGNVSMQLLQFGNDAAKAIRSKRLLVNGAVPLLSSDLTRKAVRVRTNKDIYIGGAAIAGGWRLPAGATEEYPIAGTVYAYKEPPTLSIADTEYIAEANDFIRAGAERIYFIESDDGTVRLSGAFNSFPKISIDGGAWVTHPSFVSNALIAGNMIKSPLTDSIFFVRVTGSNGTSSYSVCQYTIYESKDGGRTFERYAYMNANEKVSESKINNSATTVRLTLIGNILSINQSGVCIGFNVVTKEWHAIGGADVPASKYNGSGFQVAAFLSDDFSQFIYLSNWDYLLRMSGDGGNTWQQLGGRTFSDMRFDTALNFMAIKDSSSKKIMLSNDGGVTFVESVLAAANGSEDYPTYFDDGLYLKFDGSYLKSLKLNNVTATVDIEAATVTHAPASSSQDAPYITNTGEVYRFLANYDATYKQVDKWQLNIKGDMTPAVVEVMELLS